MSATLTISDVAAQRGDLDRAGYMPVPVYTRDKRPFGFAWQAKARQRAVVPVVAQALNTGILCDGLRAIDVDIDDEAVARQVVDIVSARLGNAPQRYRSNSARRLIVYRAAEGEPVKRVIKGVAGKVEVLGRGQQFVAIGTHPSGADLEWTQTLIDMPLDDLIRISEEQIDELFTLIAPVVGHQDDVAPPPPPAAQHSSYDDDGISLAELEDLLAYIDAGCGYEDWWPVLAALHDATGGSAAGLSLADKWSATGGKKYPGYRAIERKWQSFHADGGFTKATIAEMAERNGADLAAIAAKHSGIALGPVTPEDQAAIDRLFQSFNRNAPAEPVNPQPPGPEEDATGDVDDPSVGGAVDYFDAPESILSPGGVVGDLVDWICEWASEPVRIHAVGAALTIVGTIIGRKVMSKSKPLGTALYVGALTPSGVGKQHPIDCIKVALDAASGGPKTVGALHMGWHTSLPSLVDKLMEQASRTMIVDEFAEKLIGIRSKGAALTTTALSEAFRSLWGSTHSSFSPDMSISAAVRGLGEIMRPNLSMFGASTLKEFARSLVSKDVSNGLFNRFLILPRHNPVQSQPERDDELRLPYLLSEQLKAMHDCLSATQLVLAARADGYPTPIHVPFSAEAAAMNEANRAFGKQMLAASEDDDALVLYGRYAEQIKRIALIVACGRSPTAINAAVIEAEDMTFAQRLVEYSIGQFVLMVRREMVENEAQRNHKLVLDIVRKAGRSGITRYHLTRKIKGRLVGRFYDDTLRALIEGREIVEEPIDKAAGKRGPKGCLYRVP